MDEGERTYFFRKENSVAAEEVEEETHVRCFSWVHLWHVKTHKPGEKIRPIISQVTTPTLHTKPPVILKHTLRELPYRDMDGKMYVQCDGVSMGSPLGPTFANFFMAEGENRAFPDFRSTQHIPEYDE